MRSKIICYISLLFITNYLIGKSDIYKNNFSDSLVFETKILTDSLNADSLTINGWQKSDAEKRIVRVTDFFSLIVNKDELQRNQDGLLILEHNYEPFDYYLDFSDTIISAPYFLPIVFDGKILPSNLSFTNKSPFLKKTPDVFLIDRDSIVGTLESISRNIDPNRDKDLFLLLNEEESFIPILEQAAATARTRKAYYTSHPGKVRFKIQDLSYDIPLNVTEIHSQNPFKELMTADPIAIAKPDLDHYKVKQKYWRVKGSNTLDLSQRHYTDNWKNQGSGTTQVNSLQRLDIIYRKDRIEFSHWTEWRLDIQRLSLSNSDEDAKKSELILNEDYLRTYNKLGLDAFVKKWSYILTVDIKTPLFIKKDKNDKSKKVATLFSPLELNVGLGASYSNEWKSKTNPNRSSKLIIDASPLSMQWKYVGSDGVWENNKHGVVYEDERASDRRYTKTELGSTVIATLDFKINGYTSIYSRNKFFTNYHKTLFECENTLNFRLNRFLSTKLYYYLVYDDGVGFAKKDPYWKYFSFTDEIRFGMSFSW